MAKDDLTGNETGTAPAEHTVENQSFYNPATVGSGTITEDGEYGEPLPDPTIARGLGPGRTSGGRRTPGSLLGGQTGEDTYFDAESAPATSGVDTDRATTSRTSSRGSSKSDK
jgi:hypothetical protein